jgi:hypothetical protein
MKTIGNSIVLLGLPKGTSVPSLIVRVTGIVDTMTVNKGMFPSPTPALAQVKADIDALTSAETAFKSRLGTRAARDAARAAVVADAHALRNYVQALVDASPSKAETIATNAAMTLKKTGAHSKAPLATHQKVSGSVVVVAKALKGARGSLWQYTTDGGKTWIDASPTTKATATLPDLAPGTIVQVRHRSLTKAGLSDWSPTVVHVVS